MPVPPGKRERGRIAAPFSIAERIKDSHADPATRGCSKPRPKWHAPGAAELASLSKSEICTQIANGSELKQIGVLRVRIFDSLSTILVRTLLTGSRQRDGALHSRPPT